MGLFDRRKKHAPEAEIPRNPAEEQFQAAMDLSNQEKHGEALVAFRRVLELDPGFQPEVVHYGMALAYDGMGMDDFAIEEMRKVLSLNPAHVEAHIFLGTIYARKNRLDLATREYEAALSMKPGHELAAEMRRSITIWKSDSTGETLRKLREDLGGFILTAEQQFRVRLDFSPASLMIMDGLIDAGWTPQTGGLGVLRLAGTYVGEVIIHDLGGEWRILEPPEESEVVGIGVAGVKPFFIALDKFRKGKAGSLLGSYQVLAAAVERTRKENQG